MPTSLGVKRCKGQPSLYRQVRMIQSFARLGLSCSMELSALLAMQLYQKDFK